MADLFRKNALETMANPEQLDKQVKIVRPATWVIGIILTIGMITFVLWSFLYTISDGVRAEGVLFTNNDVRQLKATRNCIVTDVLVSSGEQIQIGDVIAFVSAEDLREEIHREQENMLALDTDSEEYRNKEKEVQKMIDQYIAKTVIKSTASGKIYGITSSGNALAPGDVIASIVQDSGYNEIIAFVPIQTAQNLSVGLTAQVSPSYAPREEYGYMTGTITEISTIPVSEEGILTKMGTLSYVQGILPDTACMEVHIKLDLDDTSANQYLWSNAKGKELSVEIGTQCSIVIITKEYRPVELLL